MNDSNRLQCGSAEGTLQECHDILDALESYLKQAVGLRRPGEPNPVDLVVKLRQKIISAEPGPPCNGDEAL